MNDFGIFFNFILESLSWHKNPSINQRLFEIPFFGQSNSNVKQRVVNDSTINISFQNFISCLLLL